MTLSARRKKQRAQVIGFGLISLVFVYTTVVNSIERPPDGLKIAALFILGIMVVSFTSRMRRAFELRATHIKMDEKALEFTANASEGPPVRIIAHEPSTSVQAVIGRSFSTPSRQATCR